MLNPSSVHSPEGIPLVVRSTKPLTTDLLEFEFIFDLLPRQKCGVELCRSSVLGLGGGGIFSFLPSWSPFRPLLVCLQDELLRAVKYLLSISSISC